MKPREIVLLQGAQGDLLSIYKARGERVYLKADKALGILRVFPEAGPIHFGKNIRRLVVTKTHLGVYYTITGNRVLVGAVLDLRQAPSMIKKRMREL